MKRLTTRAKWAGGAAILALVASGGIALAAVTDKGPVKDPDQSLTAEQRDQAYNKSFDSFQARYAEWLLSDAAKRLDPSTLSREDLNTFEVSGASTLDEATDRAQVAVLGRVESVTFEPNQTVTVFQVERKAKGSVGQTITVIQPGGLFPTQNFSSGYLAESAGAPLLLKGDRAILLLNTNPARRGTWVVQLGGSGWFKVEDTKVRTAKNTKIKDVKDEPPSRVMDRIEQRAKSA